jgi:hypothetical protein
VTRGWRLHLEPEQQKITREDPGAFVGISNCNLIRFRRYFFAEF